MNFCMVRRFYRWFFFTAFTGFFAKKELQFTGKMNSTVRHQAVRCPADRCQLSFRVWFRQLHSLIALSRKFLAYLTSFPELGWLAFQLASSLPRFRCATLDCSNQPIWVAQWWRGATQNTWSGKRLSRTMVWIMVAQWSDQMAKSHYSLITGRTKVWTTVSLLSNQRPRSGHKLLQNLTTKH